MDSKKKLEKHSDLKEAEKVELAPSKEGVKVQVFNDALKSTLFGYPVEEGDVVNPSQVDKQLYGKGTGSLEEDFDLDLDEIANFYDLDVDLEVIKTEPNEKVKIEENTELILHSTAPDEFGMSSGTLFNVKDKPDLSNLLELASKSDLEKLGQSVLVAKYEGENSVIYFGGGYYFKIDKSE